MYMVRKPTPLRSTVSMEPRFFNHGDLPAFVGQELRPDEVVSMEPRFFNHGDGTRW